MNIVVIVVPTTEVTPGEIICLFLFRSVFNNDSYLVILRLAVTIVIDVL